MEQGKRISELDHLSSLSGGEIIPIVYEGRNYKTSVNDFKALFGSGSKLAVDIPVGNTTLGDALLAVDDNSEIVSGKWLLKSDKKLKAGTPYDLIFGALLYAPEVILQPTNIQTQNAEIGFTNGTLSITNLSATSCNVGTPVTFKVSLSGGTYNSESAKVTGLEYGYFQTNSPTGLIDSKTIEKTFQTVGSGYSAAGAINVTVKQGDTPVSCTENGGEYTFTPQTDGTYTISATATDRAHSGGNIETIKVYPADSSKKNIASNYIDGVTAQGATKSTLGGATLTATSKVTVVNPAILQVIKEGTSAYSDTILAYVDSSYNPNAGDTSEVRRKEENVETKYGAQMKSWKILIPTSNASILIWEWDPQTNNGQWNPVQVDFGQPTEVSYNGRTYFQYESSSDSLAANNYCVKVKK